jgi:hypothetical protein
MCGEEDRAVQRKLGKKLAAKYFVQRIDEAQLSAAARSPEICQLGSSFVAEMSQEGQKRLRPL